MGFDRRRVFLNLKLDDLPPAIRKLNPHLFLGGVEARLTERTLTHALDGIDPKRKTRKGRLRLA
jgi:hypothetical protein